MGHVGVRDVRSHGSPKLTFHSFRHTFANALKQARVDELMIRELAGHANGSITTGRDGKRLSPAVLAPIVNGLWFPVGPGEPGKPCRRREGPAVARVIESIRGSLP